MFIYLYNSYVAHRPFSYFSYFNDVQNMCDEFVHKPEWRSDGKLWYAYQMMFIIEMLYTFSSIYKYSSL